MNVRTLTPPDALKPFIRYISYIESPGFNNEQKTFTPVVDGRPGLMVQDRNFGTIFREGKELPASFLFGQSTCATDLKLNGRFKALCVYFQPHALGSLFKLNAESLTDSCLDMRMLSNGHDFANRVEDSSVIEDKVEVLNNYLLANFVGNSHHNDLLVNYVLDKIISSKGTYSLKKLREEVYLSERSFERKFKQQVGISANLFSRICRFQSSFRQFNSDEFNKLTDIAFENEYSDQSHFTRTFKEFAGSTPSKYLKKSSLVAESLSELTM